MQLTNWELIEMNWLTFCESSPWLFGSCDKVLQCEFGNWANCLKEQTFVWFFRFFESFYHRQKTLDFKLKTKITGVPRQKLAFDDGCWRVVFYRKPQSKYGCFVYAFFFWQLLRYMIIYWIYEQTVSENVKCFPAKALLHEKCRRFCRETWEAVTITKA